MSDLERFRYVYIGTVLASRDNKTYHVYYNITNVDNDGQSLDTRSLSGDNSSWFKKPLVVCGIGTIISCVKEERDGKRYLKDYKYENETWKNQDDRINWQARSRANNEAARVVADEKKNKYKDLDECLDRLRWAYLRLGGPQRAAFVAFVVNRIINSKMKG